MFKKAISFALYTLIFSLGLFACTAGIPTAPPVKPTKTQMILPPTWTLSPMKTLTPTPGPFPSDTSIPSLTQIPIYTPTPTMPPKVYAIIGADDGILIGGVSMDSRSWLQPQAINLSEIQKPMTVVSGVNSVGTVTTVHGREATACEGWPTADLNQNFRAEFPLAISQVPWELQPRPVQWLDADVVSVYKDHLVTWLAEQGIPDPNPFIHALIRVDLDGDGADEVVLNASNLSAGVVGTRVVAGDYSVVVVRKVRGNEVLTIPLQIQIYLEDEENPPRFYHLNNVFDLNGDRVYEIIFDELKFQLNQTYVYTLDGETPKLVLLAPCRAFNASGTINAIPTATPLPSPD